MLRNLSCSSRGRWESSATSSTLALKSSQLISRFRYRFGQASAFISSAEHGCSGYNMDSFSFDDTTLLLIRLSFSSFRRLKRSAEKKHKPAPLPPFSSAESSRHATGRFRKENARCHALRSAPQVSRLKQLQNEKAPNPEPLRRACRHTPSDSTSRNRCLQNKSAPTGALYLSI